MDVNVCSHEQSYDGRKSDLPERVEVLVRPERLRRWSSAAKLAIIGRMARAAAELSMHARPPGRISVSASHRDSEQRIAAARSLRPEMRDRVASSQ